LKSTPERPAGQRLWGGAFEGAVDPVIDAFTRSFPFDRRLAVSDLVGSLAHARMLFETGVLDRASSASVLEGLSSLLRRVESGELVVDGPDEDVHTWIERKLTDEVGDAGRRLHTARSRNDQTAVALRLWQRRAVERAVLAAVGLVEVLLRRAREEVDTVLPGYTHTQRAQPTTLAHHLLFHARSVPADAGRPRRAPLASMGLVPDSRRFPVKALREGPLPRPARAPPRGGAYGSRHSNPTGAGSCGRRRSGGSGRPGRRTAGAAGPSATGRTGPPPDRGDGSGVDAEARGSRPGAGPGQGGPGGGVQACPERRGDGGRTAGSA